MNKLYILIALGLLPVFIFSVAHAFSPVPVSTTVVSGFLSIGKLSSANSMLYAALIAIGLFVVFEVALERTQLSNGSIPISIVFALIVFFVLYSDSALLHFFVNVVMVMTLILIILGMLALIKSPRSIRIIGLVVALFLVYILFVNDSGLTNSIDSVLHINLLQILPLILGVVTVFAIILFFVKGIRNSSNPNVKILFAFIIVLIVALLIPGFASFLFNPIIGVILLIAIVLAVLMMKKLSRGPKVKLTKAGKAAVAERKTALKEQKKAEKIVGKKNIFTENMGNKESGDLFDMANAVNSGAMVDAKGRPVIPKSKKEARRLYKDMVSKERRNNDIAKLLKQRQDYQSPDLFLSNSTRNKLIKRLDKKLNKLTGNKIVPKSLQEINADKLRKEQIQQARQELSEDDRIAQAQLKDARRQAAADQQPHVVFTSYAPSEEEKKAELQRFFDNMRQLQIKEQAKRELGESQKRIAANNADKGDFTKALNFWDREGSSAERENYTMAKEYADKKKRELMEELQKQRSTGSRNEAPKNQEAQIHYIENVNTPKENKQQGPVILPKSSVKTRIPFGQWLSPNPKKESFASKEDIEKFKKETTPKIILSNEEIQKQVANELEKQPPGEPIKKQNFFERFSSKAGRNGTGRRNVIQIGEKNEEASNQAGIDIYNAKRVAGVFSTQEERELQSLLENAYKTAKDNANQHINDPRPQEQITKIKKARKYIVGNPDKAAARKALEDLKKRL
jgi:hypothetical protein